MRGRLLLRPNRIRHNLGLRVVALAVAALPASLPAPLFDPLIPADRAALPSA